MKKSDLTWLAGFLEGEGYFAIRSSVAGYKSWRVVASSTDEDVLRRAAALMGGKARGPYSRPGVKPNWRVDLQDRESVVRLIQKLRPYMGVRRRARIDAMLAVHETYKPQED